MSISGAQYIRDRNLPGWLVKDAAAISTSRHRSFKSR